MRYSGREKRAFNVVVGKDGVQRPTENHQMIILKATGRVIFDKARERNGVMTSFYKEI